MIAAVIAAVIAALGACSTPTPSLEFALAAGPSQACPSTQCTDVPMSCPTVIFINMVDPANPAMSVFSQCTDVPPDFPRDICSLSKVDLDSTPIPVRDLDVQVAVYPRAALDTKPTGEPICPSSVSYNASTGFPVEQTHTPALGGHTYYHPGDRVVLVTLGCSDYGAIAASCLATNDVTVTATVDQFDTQLAVSDDSTSVADDLLVTVGEPHLQASHYELTVPDTTMLQKIAPTGDGDATWQADVELPQNKWVCLDVWSDQGTVPPVLRCREAGDSHQLLLRGEYIPQTTIDSILGIMASSGQASSGPRTLPSDGLTIGLVVNDAMVPMAGFSVSADMGSVSYLTSSAVAGTATSASGIFVSSDAPFGTTFSIDGASGPASKGIGGLVDGKITVVILTVDGG